MILHGYLSGKTGRRREKTRSPQPVMVAGFLTPSLCGPPHLTALLYATADFGGFLFTPAQQVHLVLHNQYVTPTDTAVILWPDSCTVTGHQVCNYFRRGANNVRKRFKEQFVDYRSRVGISHRSTAGCWRSLQLIDATTVTPP
jgi:hypothetical protein